MAKLFPGALAFSTFGFELSLSAAETDADFVVRLSRDNSGPEILNGELPQARFSTQLLDYPYWSALKTFGKRWKDSSPYHDWRDIWLEFDVRKQRFDDYPIPNFLFPSSYSCRRHRAANEDVVQTSIESTYSLLTDNKLAGPVRNGLRSCLRRLPSLQTIYYLGLMLPRKNGGVRLCIKDHTPKEARRCLGRIGWPGDIDVLESMWLQAGQAGNRARLDVDVGEHLGPVVGLEWGVHPENRPVAMQKEALDAIVGFLDRQQLGHSAKLNALHALPVHLKTDPAHCPAPLREVIQAQQGFYESYFIVTVSHIKLAYDGQSNWESKAYISVHHVWRGMGQVLRGHGKWGLIF